MPGEMQVTGVRDEQRAGRHGQSWRGSDGAHRCLLRGARLKERALSAAHRAEPVDPGRPSRTALGAAAHRAAHQVLEHGRILEDPLALRILGPHAEEAMRRARSEGSRRGLRLFIAARSRFAEDSLQIAVERGVRQLVVLGAGLDTLAYRSPLAGRLRMFEVDHPATQAWKRERLAAADIAIPPSLTFAPIDFERKTLAAGLAGAGFDPQQPTFFTWLGVVPYLSEAAVFSTLGFIAGLVNGAHVVFDYANPRESLAVRARAAHDALATRVAAAGEALRTSFETELLHARLRALGFQELEDLGPPQIAVRLVSQPAESASERGGHLIRASIA
ncbi:MAG TPA: class I SAM-dependent methyltransferase [Steroidobacteraceae bacterium]|nr:class I SAM-dependent methyltransferase [Steroidobacteraceae bacterium]